MPLRVFAYFTINGTPPLLGVARIATCGMLKCRALEDYDAAAGDIGRPIYACSRSLMTTKRRSISGQRYRYFTRESLSRKRYSPQ